MEVRSCYPRRGRREYTPWWAPSVLTADEHLMVVVMLHVLERTPEHVRVTFADGGVKEYRL